MNSLVVDVSVVQLNHLNTNELAHTIVTITTVDMFSSEIAKF